MMRRQLLGLLGAASLVPTVAAAVSNPGYDVQPWGPKQAVPAGDLVDLEGQHWSLPDLRGRVVLLNFWASWCEPCRTEMPALQTLAARESERMVVLAINLKESFDAIARFINNTRLALPVVRDVQGDIAKAWGIRIYPSTVLMDTESQVRGVVRGALDWAGPEGDRLWQPLLQPQRARKR